MVELEGVGCEEEEAELKSLIEKHFKVTRSSVAEGILTRWPDCVPEFIKVMPVEYRRVLEEKKGDEEAA
jgi:glutamate synthase domain-containing protein 3